ncbi:MAG: universal stress protein [Proteobacteria bacterium]|nr:universal stress protein [Pseudomonadota bacterium]
MGTVYQRIILATDLGPQSLYIGHQAKKLTHACQANLMVLHVIEPPMTYTVHFADREIALNKAQEMAMKSLNALCEQLDVPFNQQTLRIGSPQDAILDVSQKHQCDLIVVGSHGIGGYTHSLGSTAHHLLNHAHCDVLTIQVSHLQKHIEAAPAGRYLWQISKPSVNSLLKNIPQAPKFGGSKHGFGEEIRRGPRPSMRPRAAPYHGGTRKTKEEEGESNQDD